MMRNGALAANDCHLGGYAILFRIMDTHRTISFRIPAKKVDSLDELASEMDRDRSYLLNEAVEYYLELNRYQLGLIEKGIAAAKAGDFLEHSKVRKMIGKMGRAK